MIDAFADIPAGVKDHYEYNKKDSSIVIVKKRLQELGYFEKGTEFSDIVSEGLKETVILFQKKNNVSMDGVLDKDLLELLFSDRAVTKQGKKVLNDISNATETVQKKEMPVINNLSHSDNTSSYFGFILFFIILIVLIAIIIKYYAQPKLYNISEELSRIDNLPGQSFELWCVKLLRKLGYCNIQTTKATGDYGADIVCNYSGNRVVVQCKRYRNHVGIRPVQEVLGARAHYNAELMIVITNNYFTQAANNLARESGVSLWDRSVLSKKMSNVNYMYAKENKKNRTQGTSPEPIYRIENADSDSVTKKSDTQGTFPESIIRNKKTDSDNATDKQNKMAPDASSINPQYGDIRHDYEFTIERRYDNSTYVLYRSASSENEALYLINRVIDVNETVKKIKDLGVVRKG